MNPNQNPTQNPTLAKIKRIENALASSFVGRDEEARVAVLALLTKQHAVLIGEPGTAKSALIRMLSHLVQAKYFYYLLSRYTVPDELVGAIDPIEYRNGRFVRNTRGKMPDAEIVFIDEVFKGSSETLNALLSIMNERVFVDTDGTVYSVPLWTLYGASNEVPSDSELAAFYDRFLLKHFVRRIDATMIERAIVHNIEMLSSSSNHIEPVATLDDIRNVYSSITAYMIDHAHAIAKTVSQLVIVLRQHGIFISDRTATSPNHLPRLVATYSYIYQTDLRKAAIAVSKYVLPSEEFLEAYRKALDELMPPEIREAQEKLEKAQNHAANGELAPAKRLAAEALQITQSVFSKPEKVDLFREELNEIISKAEKLIREISEIEERLKKFRRG